MEEKTFICVDCSHYQDQGNTCETCGQHRVVYTSVVKPLAQKQLGDDWWDACFRK